MISFCTSWLLRRCVTYGDRDGTARSGGVPHLPEGLYTSGPRCRGFVPNRDRRTKWPNSTASCTSSRIFNPCPPYSSGRAHPNRGTAMDVLGDSVGIVDLLLGEVL